MTVHCPNPAACCVFPNPASALLPHWPLLTPLLWRKASSGHKCSSAWFSQSLHNPPNHKWDTKLLTCWVIRQRKIEALLTSSLSPSLPFVLLRGKLKPSGNWLDWAYSQSMGQKPGSRCQTVFIKIKCYSNIWSRCLNKYLISYSCFNRLEEAQIVVSILRSSAMLSQWRATAFLMRCR